MQSTYLTRDSLFAVFFFRFLCQVGLSFLSTKLEDDYDDDDNVEIEDAFGTYARTHLENSILTVISLDFLF